MCYFFLFKKAKDYAKMLMTYTGWKLYVILKKPKHVFVTNPKIRPIIVDFLFVEYCCYLCMLHLRAETYFLINGYFVIESEK